MDRGMYRAAGAPSRITTNFGQRHVMPQVASPTDEELLGRARAGDDRAFRQIVERYEDKVAATVIGMLGQGHEADDVGQETFIRFYRAMHAFRGESALGTYLTRIAINQALKTLKRRQNWRKRFFSRDEVDAPNVEPVVEGDDLDERERSRIVHASLETLSPEHRAVVVLRMLEGYSTRETAVILDIAEGTVMSRLSRALSRLEQTLAPLLGPHGGTS